MKQIQCFWLLPLGCTSYCFLLHIHHFSPSVKDSWPLNGKWQLFSSPQQHSHQLRVGSGELSAEETARGSGPAEWKQSSWKTASAPAKSRQVKNPSGGSLFLAFGSRAELTSTSSVTQLQAAEHEPLLVHHCCEQWS